MGLWETSTMVMVLLAMSILSSASRISTIKYYREGEGAAVDLLRSEEEMRWLYEEWMVEYNKSYPTPEERERRFEIFKDTLQFIDEHNHPKNNHSYTVGLNCFSDLTNEEYRSRYLNTLFNQTQRLLTPDSDRYMVREGEQLPISMDWRDYGAVGRVKNQGNCLCCWAFTAIGAVEGLNQIQTGNLITLSEQQVVDCSTRNGGCKPNYMDTAYQYIINNGGVDTDLNYPYKGVQETCRRNTRRLVTIDRYEYVPRRNERALMKAVAGQPVGVGIEGYGQAFQNYKSGIFRGPCGTALDHAVLIVGYGTTNYGEDYWIVKNSWSKNWGDNGYVKMARNIRDRSGTCGIAAWASYPVKDTWPSSSSTTHNKKSSF